MVKEDSFGICTECGDWCLVLDPCCSAGIWFEGDVLSIGTIEKLIDENNPHFDRKEK